MKTRLRVLKRVFWADLDATERDRVLRRPDTGTAAEDLLAVRRILDTVRLGGDRALQELTLRYDGLTPASLRVSGAALSAAEHALPSDLRPAIEQAAGRLRRYHEHGRPVESRIDLDGVECVRRPEALGTVGLYVPAGRAPLPSTAMMLAVPARVAGCKNIVVCTPPKADGRPDPVVLGVLSMLGVDEVFCVGGAQAIGAMAYGSESVPKCDKLFGPGNRWVTLAKQLVSAEQPGTRIDLSAGPSEVMLIADGSANPWHAAADLISQAEHGEDAHVVLVGPSPRVIERIQQALAHQLDALSDSAVARRSLARGVAVVVDTLDDAADVANRHAPEHLVLMTENAGELSRRVHTAGCICVGPWTPVALGDYCSGPSHVLPTGGTARAASGLCVADFYRFTSIQTASRGALEALAPVAVALASAEGLPGHAAAVEARLHHTAWRNIADVAVPTGTDAGA